MNNFRNNIFQILFVLLLTGCGFQVTQIFSNKELQPCCNPLPEDQIKSQAKEQTVMITGKGQGTGVIIGQDGYKHYVLTSKHTVSSPPATNIQYDNLAPDEQILANDQNQDKSKIKEEPYKIIAYDGNEFQEYIINYEQVKTDPKLDLAIIEFDSQNKGKKYKITRLSSLPVSNSQIAYIYGFKDCIDESRSKREEFNQGTILSDSKNIEEDEGYTVKYTNPTIRGMSGSPIYDLAGRVVSIHGKPGVEKGDYVFRSCPSLSNAYGNNYGISIETFKKSELAKSLPFKLAFEQRPIDSVLTKGNKSNDSSSNDTFNGKIRFKKSDSK